MKPAITQKLLDDLQRKALAATPGEWAAYINMRSGTFAVHTPDDERKGNIVGWPGFDGDARSSKKQAAANARHVAAANPAVILALTDIAQNSLQSQEGQHPDDIAVDRFAAAMKEKLKLAREKGRGGWELCSQAVLSRMLREHVEKGDPRDVANFCMMLWNNGTGIATVPPWVSPAVAQPVADDAARYRKWRKAMLEDDAEFADLMASALPKEVGVSRLPTADEWDAALDFARAALCPPAEEGGKS